MRFALEDAAVPRRRLYLLMAAASAFAVAANCYAGMPRGAELSADEQDADPDTGVTLAKGNAEIRIDAYRILGRADQIELNPARKEIQFIGHALITVGGNRYESERVTCAIDFNTCAVVTEAAPAASSNAATSIQSAPPPAGVGAASIKP